MLIAIIKLHGYTFLFFILNLGNQTNQTQRLEIIIQLRMKIRKTNKKC
jgi:hypothetical protein